MTTNHLGLEHITERFMARLAQAYQGRLACLHLIAQLDIPIPEWFQGDECHIHNYEMMMYNQSMASFHIVRLD